MIGRSNKKQIYIGRSTDVIQALPVPPVSLSTPLLTSCMINGHNASIEKPLDKSVLHNSYPSAYRCKVLMNNESSL